MGIDRGAAQPGKVFETSGHAERVEAIEELFRRPFHARRIR
jgi:hypothetical protein